MTDNIIEPEFVTYGRVPPERVLSGAPEMAEVVVIGVEPDGTLYVSSASEDCEATIAHIRRGLRYLENVAWSND